MQDRSDAQLLRDYAERGIEAAFHEIVARHTDLVYSAALRQVNSPDLAKDVAQGVFIDLARKAKPLTDILAAETSLVGWLYRGTRFTALNLLRHNRRRIEHERQAMEHLTPLEPDPDWERIRPVLDEALTELNDEDRDALLLRYFKNQDFRTIGQAQRVSDDAAQKRVSRALEKLRAKFNRRGVTTSASALAAVMSANAVTVAPAGLTSTISAAALAGTAVSTLATIAITKTVAMTTLQKTLITAALAAAVGTGIFEAHQASKLREQNQTLQEQQTSLAKQIHQLQNERDDATNQLAGLLAVNTQLQSNANETELLKLRSEVTQFQTQTNDPTTVAAKAWLERANQLKQWADQNPAATIPEFQLLTKQDWLNAARKPLNTETDYRRAMSSLRDAAESKVANILHGALHKYMRTNNGQFPTDLNQLEPDLDTAVAETILQRWEIVPSKTIPNLGMGGAYMITEKTAVDDLLDSRIAIGPSGFGSTDWLSSELRKTLQPVYKAFAKAHPNENWDTFTLSQYLPYATTSKQQAAIQKMIERQQLKSVP